nr:hypothetical protein BaRGS_030736 [Batillaria attramentaria]
MRTLPDLLAALCMFSVRDETGIKPVSWKLPACVFDRLCVICVGTTIGHVVRGEGVASDEDEDMVDVQEETDGERYSRLAAKFIVF